MNKIGSSTGTSPVIPQDVQDVGDNFESLFLDMILEKMRESTALDEEDRLIPRSSAEKIYQGLLDTEYAKLGAKNSSLGISKIVVEQLMKDQGTKK